MRKTPLALLGLILVVLFVFGALQIYTNRKAEESLRTILSEFGIERPSYRSVRYSLLNGRTEVNGLLIKGDGGETYIDKLIITKLTDTDLEFTARGIRGKDKAFREFERDMRELGYERASFNLHLSASLYEDTKELMVRDISLELPSALLLKLKFKLLGIDRKLMKELQDLEGNKDDREKTARIANRLRRVFLEELTFKLTDYGLIKRLLEKEAKDKKTTPDELKREILRELNSTVARNSSELERSIARSVSALIERGGTLVVNARPSKPVRFDELVVYTLMGLQTKDFSALVRKLNISVKHEAM